MPNGVNSLLNDSHDTNWCLYTIKVLKDNDFMMQRKLK